MIGTLKLRLKDIDNFNSSGDNFDVKLKNGAGCSFDKSTLECKYNVKSHNPFSQPINDPNEDYRFTEQIKVENIELKPSEKEASSETNKTFDSKITGDTKITYVGKYPTYSDLDTDRNINITSKNGESIVNIKEFSGYNQKKGIIYFIDIDKGGTQAIVKFKEDPFMVENKGFVNIGSVFMIGKTGKTSKEFDLESKSGKFKIDQTSSKVDLESKSGTLEYNDTDRIEYYTEPYSAVHNLEINIMNQYQNAAYVSSIL